MDAILDGKDGMLLDLTDAFDTLEHAILLIG